MGWIDRHLTTCVAVVAGGLAAVTVAAAMLTSANAEIGYCRARLCSADGCVEPGCNDTLRLLNGIILALVAVLAVLLIRGSLVRPGRDTRLLVAGAMCLVGAVWMYGGVHEVYPFEALPGQVRPGRAFLVVGVVVGGALIGRWWALWLAFVPVLLAIPLGRDEEGALTAVYFVLVIPAVAGLLAVGVVAGKLGRRVRPHLSRSREA